MKVPETVREKMTFVYARRRWMTFSMQRWKLARRAGAECQRSSAGAVAVSPEAVLRRSRL